jgi:hypothetical protein
VRRRRRTPLGDPQRLERTRGADAVDGPWFGLQRRDEGARLVRARKARRARRVARHAGGGGEQHRRPIGALGTVEQALERAPALLPAARCGPAVVDDQDERTGPRQPRLRVQQRMGEGEDHQGGDREPQQQQPPGRARGRLFAGTQLQQQPDRREGDVSRCGRGYAQQPPERRQRGERRQPERRQEADRAERAHALPRPRAPSALRESATQSAISALSGDRSVRWIMLRQPSARAMSPRPSR